MEVSLFLQMVLMSLLAVFIYTIIGFIPGTDETSVLMPITLAVIFAGFSPIVVLSFFISAIVTLNLINAIPTALVGLPGGVMSSPMIKPALYLKTEGKSALLIKKMAVGSLIGVIIAIPASLLLANLLLPFANQIKDLGPLLLFIGAIFLSLLSKNKILSLLSIIPISMLFMGLRHLYWGIGVVDLDVNITTSFFLGITIGPLILSLFEMMNKEKKNKMLVSKKKEIIIPSDGKVSKTLNPFKILSKKEIKNSAIGASVVNFLFVLSPVGLTILFGELISSKIKNPIQKAFSTIVSMSALIQATYLSGIIIPLIALGIPLSPTAIGPGQALFNAQPVYNLDNNIHHLLSRSEFTIAILVAAAIAVTITYVIVNKYARAISKFVLEKIPHEAILGLFVAFIFLLAYMDAGIVNIFGVVLIGLVTGMLNRLGVSYGVLFMTLYAAPFIIEKLLWFYR